jgi:hypothetical protein
MCFFSKSLGIGLGMVAVKSHPGTYDLGWFFLEILVRGSSRSSRLLPADRISSVGLKRSAAPELEPYTPTSSSSSSILEDLLGVASGNLSIPRRRKNLSRSSLQLVLQVNGSVPSPSLSTQ